MPAKTRSRRSATAIAAVVLPRRERRRPRGRVQRPLRRLAPSRRSLAAGLGIVVIAIGAYAFARETSVFAIRAIDVRGGPAAVDAQVRQVLAPLVGTSLVGLDGAALVRHAEALPTVVRVSYDRAFPHTLRVTVVPERPGVVLRAGAAAWLVSVRARVVDRMAPNADPGLPRIWLPASASIWAGEVLPPAQGGVAARAVAHAGPFSGRVRTAAYTHGALVFELRSGIELRLGDASNLRLKLAVATRTLRLVPAGTAYLDVGMPERPVSGTASTEKPPGTKSSSGG